MAFRIFDRRAIAASAVALGVMVVTFVGGYAWLQVRMLQMHDKEIFGGIVREAAIRDQFDRTVGRDEFTRSLEIQRKLDAEPPKPGLANRYRTLFAADGSPIIGDVSVVPNARELIARPGQRLRYTMANGVEVYATSVRLADGAVLVVAQIDRSRTAIARDIGRVALSGIFAVLTVGVLTILALNRFVLEHVTNLGKTARQIMRGQMTARASTPSRRLDSMGALTVTFNEMLDQNEALVSGMRTVTESLAHDLRTPLMRVRRSIEAARNADDAEQRQALLNDAEAGIGRALQTFNSLVDIARAEAGLSHDSMESLNLGTLATDLLELFEPLAEERGQRIECSVDDVTVVGHPQILKQAVGNLIENAIKYSPDGTTLKLAVNAAGAEGGPEIIVQDRGPGIPGNAREQAVRPFVRLENPSQQPGSGMGLAIAAAVARLHRGRLILESGDPGLRVRLQFGSLAAT